MPRRHNVLSPEPGCSLQEVGLAASHPAPVEAGDCGRPRLDETGGTSSGNRHGPRATCAGCRAQSQHIRDRSRFCDGDSLPSDAAGTPAGCKRSGPGGTSRAQKSFGKNGRSATRGISSGSVQGDPSRKSEFRNSYRVTYRVLASGGSGVGGCRSISS